MKIIAFEGLDASGKETQTRLLIKALRKRGYSVGTESFPRYDKPIGILLKQWLTGNINLSDQAAHMLYEADRQDFMDWLQEMHESDTVKLDYLVVDRYALSNLAFGDAKGLDTAWTIGLQDCYPREDLSIVLDIDSQTSYERKKEGRDLNEQNLQLLDKARESYLNIKRLGLYPVEIIDAMRTPEEVHGSVMQVLEARMII